VQIVNSKRRFPAGIGLIPAPRPSIPSMCLMAEFRGKRPNHGTLRCSRTSVGGRDSIISINRGTRHGLEVGHVLALYRNVVVYDQRDYLKSRAAHRDTAAPERYGLVFVFVPSTRSLTRW